MTRQVEERIERIPFWSGDDFMEMIRTHIPYPEYGEVMVHPDLLPNLRIKLSVEEQKRIMLVPDPTQKIGFSL